MGRSFHWMDRAETLRRLDLLVEGDGALALFNDELVDAPENAALKGWSAVVKRYSADDTVRMERRSAAWQQHEVLLAVSPFSRLERLVQVHRSTTSAERLIHRALSMSATSAARLGSRTGPMLEEIQAALAPFGSPSGELRELIEWTAIIGRRRQSTAPSAEAASGPRDVHGGHRPTRSTGDQRAPVTDAFSATARAASPLTRSFQRSS
jgi:hypothetical protein